MNKLENDKKNLFCDNRINFIDVARGIAILLVVLGHITPTDEGIGQYIYSFHMPVFFIITGFLLFSNDSWKNMTTKDYLKKKASSLLYPYFTFSFLSIIKIMLTTGLYSAAQGIITTITFEGILALWFLPALFLAELVFYFIEKRAERKYIILLIVIFTTFFRYIEFQRCENHTIRCIMQLVNEVNRSLIGVVFIYVGYFYGKIRPIIFTKRATPYIIAIAALIIDISLFRYNYVDLHYSILGNPILYYANAISGSYVLLFISEKILNKVKFFGFLGKNSIIIFATHRNFSIINMSRSLFAVCVRYVPFLANYSIVGVFVIIMIIEIILVLLIRKMLYFIVDFSTLQKIVSKINKKNN